MRTTIELRDDQRARLLAIAARRGEKGFSRLVQDAVDRYLEEEDRRGSLVDDALTVMGTLADQEAEHARKVVGDLRASWGWPRQGAGEEGSR